MKATMKPVAVSCGCMYLDDGKPALGPVSACDAHRYITCSRCNGRAEVTPFGTMCPRCSFR